MVGSSKILTVSYGTFSCTLEGFDDSFETMKAIAEYFRDLAADDRYFGAEPPTPDADMLARIAEREISRRVQAHEDRGRIVLRAGAAPALSTAAESAPLAEQAAPQAPETPPETPPEMTAAAVSAPEGIETEAVPRTTEPVAEFAEPLTEAAPQEAPLPEPVEPEPVEAEPQAVAPVQDAWTGAQDSEEDAGSETEFADNARPVAQDDLAPYAESGSIAAKLNLIRSVVSETVPTDDQDYSEDEHAQDFLDSTVEDLDAVLAADDLAERFHAADDLEGGSPETEIAKEQAPTTSAYGEDDDFEDSLAELMADALPVSQTPGATRETAVIVEQIAFEATVEHDVFDDEESEVTDPFHNIFGAKAEELATDDYDDLHRDLTDRDGDLRLEFDDLPREEANLDTEDEEVAEAEAEADSSDEIDDEMDDSPVAPDLAVPGRERLHKADDSGDLMRFFEEADSQLDTPASSQRRNAIQHLRAAVAATRAERKAGSELHRDVDDAPYRSDLASVVRPRRPQAAPEGSRSLRPDEPRPAPLKLVAEQRIDTPRAPIQPRRISGAALRAEIERVQPDSGFVAFVEELGITHLPDLLEAAAAYLADVEGRPQFSRPMLMSKLKEVEAETYSREDGLRSFGQLLRAGKLQKLSGGRFSVTKETEYRQPGKRHAG